MLMRDFSESESEEEEKDDGKGDCFGVNFIKEIGQNRKFDQFH